MTILVVSTGNAAPTKEKCLASVAMQEGVEVEHVYREAATQSPRLGVMQNRWEAIWDRRRVADEDIVAIVDGDDWLLTRDALAKVQAVHDAGAWLTWGSFELADGRPGCCARYGDDDPRTTPWRMSHLKTFRAVLFHRIQREHLQRDGDWLQHALDLAIMFPMYEMCPPERRCFIPDILYAYNLATSHEWNAPPDGLQHEREDVAYVRGLPRYERIEKL